MMIMCVLFVSLVEAKRFDVNNGVVIDNATKMMWQKSDDNKKRSWRSSKKYCQKLKFAGFSDWRLPNIDELVSITDKNSVHPTIHSVFESKQVYYWSSSSVVKPNEKVNAWGVLFKYGYNRWNDKNDKNFARCVRDYRK